MSKRLFALVVLLVLLTAVMPSVVTKSFSPAVAAQSSQAGSAVESNQKWREGQAIVRFTKELRSAPADDDVVFAPFKESLRQAHQNMMHLQSLTDQEVEVAVEDIQGLEHTRNRGLKLLKTNLTTDDLIDLLKQRQDVVSATPNYILAAASVTWNDEFGYLQEQAMADVNFLPVPGFLGDVGLLSVTVNADSAVRVVIADGASRWQNLDLTRRAWHNAREIPGNGIDDDANGYTDDVDGYSFVPAEAGDDPNGHGHNTSGLVGAEGNNGRLIAGIAGFSNVQLVPLKILFGGRTDLATILSSSGWTKVMAVRERIAAINFSVDFAGLQSPDLAIAFKELGDVGVNVVLAAGNDNGLDIRSLDYLSSLDNVIIVGGETADQRDPGSNQSSLNGVVRLYAPWDAYSLYPGDGLGHAHGTSMSAPHVTATVALLRQMHSDWTPCQIRDYMVVHARHAGVDILDVFNTLASQDAPPATDTVTVEEAFWVKKSPKKTLVVRIRSTDLSARFHLLGYLPSQVQDKVIDAATGLHELTVSKTDRVDTVFTYSSGGWKQQVSVGFRKRL